MMIARSEKPPRIAILGWGSLLWDKDDTFDKQHSEWLEDGPVLPLEFCRVSKRRKNALTLVIDPVYGQNCTVQYAMSTHKVPNDAITDLCSREGTILKRIGFYFADGHRICVPNIPETIPAWAAAKRLDAVVWTGLSSNFMDETKEAFSIAAAIRHIQSLSPAGKSKAAEYVWRAPDCVQSPLRTALQGLPWFTPPAST